MFVKTKCGCLIPEANISRIRTQDESEPVLETKDGETYAVLDWDLPRAVTRIPNTNPNLVGLSVCLDEDSGEYDAQEEPIIAWEIFDMADADIYPLFLSPPCDNEAKAVLDKNTGMVHVPDMGAYTTKEDAINGLAERLREKLRSRSKRTQPD